MVNGFDDFLINLHNPQLFRRIVNRLMALEYGDDYICPDDDRGDGGNDGYIQSKKRLHAVHCLKREVCNDKKVLVKARSDLAKAVELHAKKQPIVKEWSFITAYRLPSHIIQTLTNEADAKGFVFVSQGPDLLAAMIAKNADHLQDIPEISLAVKVREARLTIQANEKPTTRNCQPQLVEVPVARNDDEFHKVTKIMRQGRAEVQKNINTIQQIYRSGKTYHARLQAGLALLQVSTPSEISFSDAIAQIDSLISLAGLTGDSATLAVLYSERGQRLNQQFVTLDLKSTGDIQISNIFGLSAYTPTELDQVVKNLHSLQESYKEAFDKAIELAYEKDWATLGSVAIRIGNAAGMRYCHFHGLNIDNRAEQEKYHCKRMFDLAQNAFIATNDRNGQLVVQHNLANQLRFMGEEQEAIRIIKFVMKEAESRGYADILDRASELCKRLEEDASERT